MHSDQQVIDDKKKLPLIGDYLLYIFEYIMLMEEFFGMAFRLHQISESSYYYVLLGLIIWNLLFLLYTLTELLYV